MGDFYLVTDNAAFDIAFINYYLAVHLAAPPLTNRAARSDGMSQDSSASDEEPRSFIPPVDVRSLVCGLPTSLLTAGRARRHQFLPAPWGSAKALCRNVLAKACPGAKTHMPDDDAFIIGWHFGQLLSYLGEQAAALQSHLSHAAALGVTGNDMAMPGTFLHYALGLQHLKHGSATGATSARVPGGVSMATTVTFSPPGQQQNTLSGPSRRRAYSEEPHASSLAMASPPFLPMSPPPSATRIDLASPESVQPPPTSRTHTNPPASGATSAAVPVVAASTSYVLNAQAGGGSVTTQNVAVEATSASPSRKARVAEGWESTVASAAKSALVTAVAVPPSGGGGSDPGVLEARVPPELHGGQEHTPLRGHEAAASVGNPLGLLPPVTEFLVPSLQSVHNMAKLTFKYNQGHYGKPGGGWIKCFPVDALVHDLMTEHGPSWAVSGFHPLRTPRKRGAEGREHESMVQAHDGTQVPRVMVDRLCGVLMEAYAMAVTFCRGGASHSHCTLPYPAQDSAMWAHPAVGGAGRGGAAGNSSHVTPPWDQRRGGGSASPQDKYPARILPLPPSSHTLHSLPEGSSLHVQAVAAASGHMLYRSHSPTVVPSALSAGGVSAQDGARTSQPPSPEWRSSPMPAKQPPAQMLPPAHSNQQSSSGMGFTMAGAMQKMGWSMQGMAALASMNPSVWGGSAPSAEGGLAASAEHGTPSGTGRFGLVPAEAFGSRRRGGHSAHRASNQRRRPRSQSEDSIALHSSHRPSGGAGRGQGRGRGNRRGGRGGSSSGTAGDKQRRRPKGTQGSTPSPQPNA